MLQISAKSPDIKSFVKKLTSFISRPSQVYQNESEELAREAVAILTEYPGEGPGNFPPAPYWERGVGLIGGQGQLLNPSSKYGNSADRWSYTTTTGDDTTTTTATTSIPYAPYLGNPQRQAGFHKARGWKTTDDAIARVEESQLARNKINKIRDRVANFFGL